MFQGQVQEEESAKETEQELSEVGGKRGKWCLGAQQRAVFQKGSDAVVEYCREIRMNTELGFGSASQRTLIDKGQKPRLAAEG